MSRRRGNRQALMKAVRSNPRMSAATKRKALATLKGQIGRSRSGRGFGRGSRRSGNLGMQGFREAGMATVKLASQPVSQAVETYHLINGLNKIWRWLNGRSR